MRYEGLTYQAIGERYKISTTTAWKLFNNIDPEERREYRRRREREKQGPYFAAIMLAVEVATLRQVQRGGRTFADD